MGDAPPAGRADPQRSETAFVDGFTSWLLALRRARPQSIPIYVLACDAVSGQGSHAQSAHRPLCVHSAVRCCATVCVLQVSGSCLPSPKEQEVFSKAMEPLLQRAVANAITAQQQQRRDENSIDDAEENIRVLALGGSPPVSHADDSDWGRIGHWSVQGHRKIAAGLEEALRPLLGW